MLSQEPSKNRSESPKFNRAGDHPRPERPIEARSMSRSQPGQENPSGGRSAKSAGELPDELVAKLRSDVALVASRRCGAAGLESDQDDVVQEAFLRLNGALIDGRFPEIEESNLWAEEHLLHIRKWLYRAVNFIVIEFSRRRVRSPRTNAEDIDERGCVSCESPIVMMDIETVIGGCTPDEQMLVRMLCDGCENWEIAEKLGISHGAARVRVHRIRCRLRRKFRSLM